MAVWTKKLPFNRKKRERQEGAAIYHNYLEAFVYFFFRFIWSRTLPEQHLSTPQLSGHPVTNATKQEKSLSKRLGSCINEQNA